MQSATDTEKGFTVAGLFADLNAVTEEEIRVTGEKFDGLEEGDTLFEKDGKIVYAPLEVIKLTTLADKLLAELKVKKELFKLNDEKNLTFDSPEWQEQHTLGHELTHIEEKIDLLARIGGFVMMTNYDEEFCQKAKPEIGKDWILYFKKPQSSILTSLLSGILGDKLGENFDLKDFGNGIGVEIIGPLSPKEFFESMEKNPFEDIPEDEEFIDKSVEEDKD